MILENEFGGGTPGEEILEEGFGVEIEEETEKEVEKEERAPLYFEDPPADAEVIGVRFRTSAKVYFFDPDGKTYKAGSHAIVETARGQEYGLITQGNHVVPGREIIQPLRKALRTATPEDDAHDEENRKKAEEAFRIGTKKIEEHGLDMKLIETEYTFDNSKLLFYFTSEGRVDFRELVKDLATVFHCRIELRQMGIRDEAKILGGLGICGRPFCCHAFLPDFVQVSIKMAKEQSLALNSAKISGACGRLMCCLRYEYDAYLEEGRLTPKVDSLVNTPDGIGVVVEAKPLVGLVKVKSLDDAAGTPRVYHRDQLTPIKKGDDNYEKALEEKSLEKQARAAGTTRAALKAAREETPEKAAQRAARAERLLQAQRAEPKKAASFTGQVLPTALLEGEKSRVDQPKETPEEELAEEAEQQRDRGARKNNRRNGRRRNKGGKERGDAGESADPGQGKNNAREKATAESGREQPRYEKISRGGEQSQNAQTGRVIEHERQQTSAQAKKNAGEAQIDGEGGAENANGNKQKKSRRPFHHHRRGGKNKPGAPQD